MRHTTRRLIRQPILLLRDALGRFARLRQPKPKPARRARRRPIRSILDAQQLVLF